MLLPCHAEVTPVAKNDPRSALPPSFGIEVDAQAAEGLLGRHGRVVHRDFLRRAGVGHEVRELSFRQHVADADAVELQPRVGLPAAVDHERGVLQVVGAADVLQRAAARAGWPPGPG